MCRKDPERLARGTNIRLTIRSGQLVRVEKRRNPSKAQKAQWIIDSWYVDTDETAADDKWILAAARGTDVSGWPDGEHSSEALGPRIQGNPLGLDDYRCLPFDMQAPYLRRCSARLRGAPRISVHLGQQVRPGHRAGSGYAALAPEQPCSGMSTRV